MKVIDPGHHYHLTCLDGNAYQILTFVKREGPGYPGNIGHHAGTTTQEVIRALLERSRYVDNQIPDEANDRVEADLRDALWTLEERAARRHGRPFPFEMPSIDKQPTCPKCNHIGCEGECHP